MDEFYGWKHGQELDRRTADWHGVARGSHGPMSHEIIHSVFSTYTEVHSAQLGVLLGLLVGLSYRDRPGLSYCLLFCGVLLAFANAPAIGFGDIGRKPWYFLSGVYVASVVAILGAHLVQSYLRGRRRSPRTHG